VKRTTKLLILGGHEFDEARFVYFVTRAEHAAHVALLRTRSLHEKANVRSTYLRAGRMRDAATVPDELQPRLF
jgi:hypothetical protein